MPADKTGSDIGSATSVSVAAYKVPDKAKKEYSKAQGALSKSNLDEALAHLNKAIETYAQYADALTLRAIVRMDKQDAPGALADLNTAIQADPGCSLAYFALGSVYNATNRFADAELALHSGLRLDPTSWQGYFELGKALVGKGDYQAGIDQLAKAQDFSSNKYAPIHLVKAHAMLALKQYPEAMAELQAFITQAPNDSRSAAARETLDKVNAFMGKGSMASK
jgi:tetratricopeptide (TPR) repeat protein